MLAVRLEDEETVQYLLKNGAQVNLIETEESESKKEVQSKILQGQDQPTLSPSTSTPTGNDMSPLHIAGFYGRTEMAKLLLENGADVNKKTMKAKHPFTLLP